MPISRSPRGRGRGRGRGRASFATAGRKEHIVVEDVHPQSDDDVVTVNSVKLGKRFALLSSICSTTLSLGSPVCWMMKKG